MSEERKLAVLRAIVEDYVATEEPVGSKALVERHGLNVSPATIRNDMAALEDEGLIVAPHTSAGRIPTDAGYRLFVDRLQAIRPMSRGERAAITDYLEGADELDAVLDRTVRLLSTLTRQVAVVQYPSLSRSRVCPVPPARLTCSSSERRSSTTVRVASGLVPWSAAVAGTSRTGLAATTEPVPRVDSTGCDSPSAERSSRDSVPAAWRASRLCGSRTTPPQSWTRCVRGSASTGCRTSPSSRRSTSTRTTR